MKEMLILALLAIITCNAQTFSGSFVYTSPNMTNGQVPGTINYDWNNKAFVLQYNLQNDTYIELYNYSQNANSAAATQWVYAYDSSCCQPESLKSFVMPKLFKDSSYVSAGDTITNNNAVCTRYTSSAATNSEPQVVSIWFANDDSLCQVAFANGGTYVFSGIQANAITQSLFQPPAQCFCSQPLNMLFIIDRSGSISFTEWGQIQNFLYSFVPQFDFQKQADMAIVSFTNSTWTSMQFVDGMGPSQMVQNRIKSIPCNNTLANANDASRTSCCSGWTSISLGIRTGADLMKRQQAIRPQAVPVIVVMSDGNPNTFFNDTRPGDSCYNPCNNYVWMDWGFTPKTGAIGNNWYHCIGDANNDSIPDTWLSVEQSGIPALSCGDQCKTSLYPNSGNLMEKCLVDLISAREYALDTVGRQTPIFVVGVNGIMPQLQLISNNLYRKPDNVNNGDLSRTWIPWTPAYASNQVVNPDWILTPSSYASLGTISNQLVRSVCKEGFKSCPADCCGFCTKCGKCVAPTCAPQPCQQSYLQGPCCASIPTCPDPTDKCLISSCDNGTNQCVSTPRTCPAPNACYTYNCDSNSGNCVQQSIFNATSDKCSSTVCDLNHDPPIYTTLTTCQAPDPCYNASCDPVKGCIFTPLTLPAAPNRCFTYICDANNLPATTDANYPFRLTSLSPCGNTTCARCDNATGGCVADTTSSSPTNCCVCENDPCITFTCQNSQCVATPKCVVNRTACTNQYCSTNGTCITENIVCPPKDCFIASCDSNVGCVYSPLPCDDNDTCTVDTCSNNTCVFTPISCTTNQTCSSAFCVNGQCQISTNCAYGNNKCSYSTCENVNGTYDCITRNYNSCDDHNPCTNDSCDPFLGCIHTWLECPSITNETCVESVCDPDQGCVSQYIICDIENGTAVQINSSDPSRNSTDAAGCINAVCRNNTCVLNNLPCYGIPTDVIVGATLGAGVIAGIIIAIIAALCIGGGGIAAYTQYHNNDGLASVHQNPLFTPSGSGGDNPLHEGH